MPSGVFAEEALAEDLPAPVHATVTDLDADGDRDVLVACMGLVPPNNDRIGSVIVLENDGRQNFAPRVLLEKVARVTDVQAGDFNADGRLDLAVAQFGYEEGEIRWMENMGGWNFRSHQLLDRAGAVNVCVADMNADSTPDIVAIVSQQWEELYLFSNDGRGNFRSKVIYDSTNEDYGSSGISLADINRDGRPDILYTNGDGFDLKPGPHPWHGVQWLENVGNEFFIFHRLGDLPGAFSPIGTDFDGDGDVDVLAVGCLSDWASPKAPTASLIWYRNDGAQDFTPVTLAIKPTHLLTAAVGDLDGDGRPEVVTGAFYAFPPFKDMSRVTLWTRTGNRP